MFFNKSIVFEQMFSSSNFQAVFLRWPCTAIPAGPTSASTLTPGVRVFVRVFCSSRDSFRFFCSRGNDSRKSLSSEEKFGKSPVFGAGKIPIFDQNLKKDVWGLCSSPARNGASKISRNNYFPYDFRPIACLVLSSCRCACRSE